MLKVENMHVSYGAVKALHGISVDVPAGKIVALVGANGAGKTSLLSAISGLVPYEVQSPMPESLCQSGAMK